jgi:hypothetical protein
MAINKPYSTFNIIIKKPVELFYKYKERRGNCSCCSKSLILYRKKYLCSICNAILCSKCKKSFESPEYLVWRESFKKLCPKCLEEKNKQYSNYDNALRSCHNVETISVNYKGYIKIIKGSEKDRIVTTFWKDKNDALISLKVSAAFINCNLIYDVRYETKEDSEGNYKFNRFSYSGIPGIKR